MVNNYGYNQYKKQSLETMTKGEILILLFDEIIKRLARAEYSLKNNNFEDFDESIGRANEIVTHLRDCLDLEFTISSSLAHLYNFFLYELSRAKTSRNVQVFDEIRPLILDLRNTFKEADRINLNASDSSAV